MDQVALQSKANRLESVLALHAPNSPGAAALLSLLVPIFRQISWGLVTAPFEWGAVPGSYAVGEGELRKHTELAEAYASFKIELTGQADSPVLGALRDRKSQP